MKRPRPHVYITCVVDRVRNLVVGPQTLPKYPTSNFVRKCHGDVATGSSATGTNCMVA